MRDDVILWEVEPEGAGSSGVRALRAVRECGIVGVWRACSRLAWGRCRVLSR